jgi:tRNA threonylcarbamoyladenosine biosynthesis protein TsaB
LIILGIDTSAYANAVGLCDGGGSLADVKIPSRTDSLEQIVANIDDVLKSSGLALSDVQGIGVGLGPGSWTGIRVGVTVGKMLAFGSGKPVIGVPTMEALASLAGDRALTVWAVIGVGAGDAVYAAKFLFEKNRVIRDGDYFTGEIKGLAALVAEPCVLIGQGAAAWAETIARESGREVEGIEASPSGAAIACLAEERLVLGESDDALALTPLYLKESTAKVFVNKYKL